VAWLLLAWRWMREHVEAVLVAVGALVLGFLAWGAYKRKVDRLTDAVKVERARVQVAALEATRRSHEVRAEELAKEEATLTEAINAAQREAVAVREETKGKSDEEIAARFNQLYR
jgi:23S rRNA pseudoU1915 N3-methylase RlmH